MKSAGTTSPPLRIRIGKLYDFIQPPIATCRCRRDLSPPTHVVSAPAPEAVNTARTTRSVKLRDVGSL